MSLIMPSRIKAREVLARFSRLPGEASAAGDPPLGQNVEALADVQRLTMLMVHVPASYDAGKKN